MNQHPDASLRRLTLVFGLLVALPGVAGLAQAQSSAKPNNRDQPPPTQVDLFQPIVAFDLTPDQQRAMERLRADPSSGAIQIFKVNLSVPKTADAVNFNFLPGGALMLSTRSRADRAPDDYSWTGGDASGSKSAALVVKDQQVTGTIRDGDKLYRVRSIGNGVTAVIEVDQKKLPPEHPPAFDREKREKSEPPPRVAALRRRGAVSPANPRTAVAARTATGASAADALGSGSTGGGASELADTPPGGAADACGTIDVFVAYTPAAEIQAGSIDGLIQLAVDETNISYSKSGIQPRLHLVGTAKTNYAESGDMEVDVARLAAPADGFLDDVPPLRDAAGADIAVLITGNGNFCGIADTILASADEAYAVVGQNCATGYYSFGHEVGHLQGARHNPEADNTASPFAYGHGFFSLTNRKRTVMSYDCPPGCTRIDAWATPQVVVDGVTMGDTALHNDARVLNETACDVAAFRAAAGSAPGPSTPVGGGSSLAPSTPTSPTTTPHRTPAASAWSLLALLGAAPWVLGRRAPA